MDYAGTVLHLVSVARSCFLLNGGDSHSTNLIVVLTMNSSLPVRLVLWASWVVRLSIFELPGNYSLAVYRYRSRIGHSLVQLLTPKRSTLCRSISASAYRDQLAEA